MISLATTSPWMKTPRSAEHSALEDRDQSMYSPALAPTGRNSRSSLPPIETGRPIISAGSSLSRAIPPSSAQSGTTTSPDRRRYSRALAGPGPSSRSSSTQRPNRRIVSAGRSRSRATRPSSRRSTGTASHRIQAPCTCLVAPVPPGFHSKSSSPMTVLQVSPSGTPFLSMVTPPSSEHASTGSIATLRMCSAALARPGHSSRSCSRMDRTATSASLLLSKGIAPSSEHGMKDGVLELHTCSPAPVASGRNRRSVSPPTALPATCLACCRRPWGYRADRSTRA